MKVWKTFTFVSFALVLMFQVGCSSTGSGEEVVTLSFWDFHTDAEKEFYQGLVDEYNSIQDEVKIEYSTFNQSDYSTTKLPVAFANQEGPDIFLTSPGDFQRYAEAGIMAELDPYFKEDVKEDFLPSSLEAVTYEDKILALPTEMGLLGLFYNKKMLEDANVEVPKTWDELLDAARKLTTDEVAGLVLPIDKGPYLNFVWYPFLWQQGGSVLNEEGTASTFNSTEAAKALDFWGTFFQEGFSPSKLRHGPTEAANIGNKTAAMQVVGTFAIPVLENNFGDTDVGVAPLPIPEGGKPATAAGGWSLAANANSEHVEEAAEFIMWAFGDEISRPVEYVTEAKFAYPPRQSVVEVAEKEYTEGLRKVFTEEIYDSAIPEPRFNAEIVDAVGEALQNVMFSDMSGEEAAEIADQKIQEALNN